MNTLPRFKEYLQEAFSAKNMSQALRSIESYLNKKIGNIYRMPSVEKFKKSNGKEGFGIHYFMQDKRSFRFNWIKGEGSSVITSIDIWDGSSNQPAISVDVAEKSIVKILPLLVKLIMNPKVGEYIEESFEEDIKDYLKEAADSMYQQVIAFMQKKGKSGFGKGDIYRLGKSEARRIFENMLDHHEEMFKISGPSNRPVYVFKGDPKKIKEDTVAPAMLSATKAAGEKIIDDEVENAENLLPKVAFEEQQKHMRQLTTAVAKNKLSNALWITGKGGTGKSFAVKEMFDKWGWQDENQYLEIGGSASPMKVYQLLYDFNGRVIFFDDADAIFSDQTGRNVLKGATDTKPVRKLSWEKGASWLYDPRKVTDPEEIEAAEEEGKYPSSFVCTCTVIAISNLPLNKIDPDGALRTRGFIINVDPTDKEFLEFIKTLAEKIQLGEDADGKPLKLGIKERDEVVEYLQNSRTPISIRKAIRGMKLRASGMPSWQELAELYA